jgi:hypothetical protein
VVAVVVLVVVLVVVVAVVVLVVVLVVLVVVVVVVVAVVVVVDHPLQGKKPSTVASNKHLLAWLTFRKWFPPKRR